MNLSFNILQKNIIQHQQQQQQQQVGAGNKSRSRHTSGIYFQSGINYEEENERESVCVWMSGLVMCVLIVLLAFCQSMMQKIAWAQNEFLIPKLPVVGRIILVFH